MLDPNKYENYQSLYYKFVNSFHKASITFEYGSPTQIINFPLLDRNRLIELNERPAKVLSIELLSEFLEKLGDHWVKFMIKEMGLIRSHLCDLASLDFVDTVEEFIQKSLVVLTSESSKSEIIEKYLDNIVTGRQNPREDDETTDEPSSSWLNWLYMPKYTKQTKISDFERKKLRVKKLLKREFEDIFNFNHESAKLKTLRKMDPSVTGGNDCLEKHNREGLAEVMVFCDEEELRKRMKSAYQNEKAYGLQGQDLSEDLLSFLGYPEGIRQGDELESA